MLFGIIAAIFLREVNKEKNINSSGKEDNQTLVEALKRSIQSQRFLYF